MQGGSATILISARQDTQAEGIPHKTDSTIRLVGGVNHLRVAKADEKNLPSGAGKRHRKAAN